MPSSIQPGERNAPPGRLARAEAARQRLGEHRVVRAAQRFGELAVVRDALGLLRARGKPRLDGTAALRIEAAVGVGLQVGLGDGCFAHFTSFSFVAAAG
jgi:hypothetical protein